MMSQIETVFQWMDKNCDVIISPFPYLYLKKNYTKRTVSSVGSFFLFINETGEKIDESLFILLKKEWINQKLGYEHFT